eukprot:TRINITY_DN7892_c0_g1_i1.p1 TRINITY_DN7892_c0_g1~~TRINITY_DN7892_c0_g1_i1.p1  ORF type:complete len:361 (+),score=94.24 TRINITY_DN7892_c0_g1_i1:87-1169(+)
MEGLDARAPTHGLVDQRGQRGERRRTAKRSRLLGATAVLLAATSSCRPRLMFSSSVFQSSESAGVTSAALLSRTLFSQKLAAARKEQLRQAALVAGTEPLNGRSRSRRTARRLFDTGAIFGVGAPEALTVGLLAWFLLGPEELYRLAKRFGGWLGDLRGFVAQAAQQYEKALDDEATKKAIVGIRQTQKQVLEVAGSWKEVADTFRDPLNVGKALESTVSRLDKETEDEKKSGDKDEKTAKAKGDDEESEEELERKKAASRAAVDDMWATVGEPADTKADSSKTASKEAPKTADAALTRLDDRLEELDDMVERLEELRLGLLEDRRSVQDFFKAQQKKEKEAVSASGAGESVAATATKVN